MLDFLSHFSSVPAAGVIGVAAFFIGLLVLAFIQGFLHIHRKAEETRLQTAHLNERLGYLIRRLEDTELQQKERSGRAIPVVRKAKPVSRRMSSATRR